MKIPRVILSEAKDLGRTSRAFASSVNWFTRRFVVLGALIAAIGCKVTGPYTCFHMEYGDCSGGTGVQPDSVRVIGFPADRVDSLDRGVLHVGETVELRLLLMENPRHYPGDTSYTVRWTLPSGITAARLVNADNGVGRLTAMAPGSLTFVVADGAQRPVWAYTNLVVHKLVRIDVVP